MKKLSSHLCAKLTLSAGSNVRLPPRRTTGGGYRRGPQESSGFTDTRREQQLQYSTSTNVGR
jgi:hypothetical protein